MIALSIRQPWAWLIVNGHKDAENRRWATNYRGRLLIHAGMGMTKDEYEICRVYSLERGVTIPAFDELERGGVVGLTRLTNCLHVHQSSGGDPRSHWFEGPFGFVMSNARTLPFYRCSGQLSFFNINIPRHLLEGEWKGVFGEG